MSSTVGAFPWIWLEPRGGADDLYWRAFDAGLERAAQVASLHAERFVEKPVSPYYSGRKAAALYLAAAIRAINGE
jgi:hypothetical protein